MKARFVKAKKVCGIQDQAPGESPNQHAIQNEAIQL